MKKLLLVSAVAASTLMASGYKIPEQSLNSTALAGAYVSNASTADATYYNPANMAFMSSKRHLEVNAMYIHLNPVDFNGQVIDPGTGAPVASTSQSASEDFIIPQIYLVSAPLGEDEDIRLGLSMNAPAGLSKRWSEGVESQYAKEFTLKVLEISPTMSYRIMDGLAVAGGVRFIYTDGRVEIPAAQIPSGQCPAGTPVGTPGCYLGHLEVEGSSWNIGWNAAVSYKPVDMWGMALTYRSEVDMTVEGGQNVTDQMLNTMGLNSVPASVGVPLPAVVTLATDVSITESTNIEFVYERVMWSAYDELQFTFVGNDAPASAKNWEDSNTFRLGLTQGLGDSLNLMLGFAYDQTPVPDESVGFELPDSDAIIGSVGVRWAVNEEMEIGAAVLYDQKADRDVEFGATQPINGTFSGSSAILASVGLGYKF